MKKFGLKILPWLLITAFVFGFSAPVYAASIFEQMSGGVRSAINQAYGGGKAVKVDQFTFLNSLIFIINSLLTFLGVVFFLLMLYSGYLWLTAHGNEEQVTRAKEMLKEIIIALIIIFFARVFTEFILTQIGNAVAGGGQPI